MFGVLPEKEWLLDTNWWLPIIPLLWLALKRFKPSPPATRLHHLLCPNYVPLTYSHFNMVKRGGHPYRFWMNQNSQPV